MLPYCLTITDLLKVKSLSQRIQLCRGKCPVFMEVLSMKTAHSAVGTEVAAAHIKSPCRSCWVMTNTGRLFSAFRFEYGNGIPTRSPGLQLIPDIIFFVFPNPFHHRLLSFLKRFDAGIPVGTDSFDELEYLSCQRLWKISCLFTNFICHVHTSPFKGLLYFKFCPK